MSAKTTHSMVMKVLLALSFLWVSV